MWMEVNNEVFARRRTARKSARIITPRRERDGSGTTATAAVWHNSASHTWCRVRVAVPLASSFAVHATTGTTQVSSPSIITRKPSSASMAGGCLNGRHDFGTER